MTDEDRDGDRAAESEDLFDVVFRTSADAMIITRLEDGLYLAVNDAFLRMSGRTRDEVIGNTSVKLDWADPADRERMVAELREKGTAGPNRATFLSADGEPRYGSYSGLIFDFHGQKAILSSVSDLTDLHDVEQELREEQAKLRMLSDNMPGFSWTTDLDLKVTSSAGSGSPELGMNPADFIGRDLRQILATDPGRVDLLQRIIEEGTTERHEADWSGRTWDIFLAPLRVDGEIVGVNGAAIDITSRRKTEEATRLYAARLHALYELELGIRSALTPEEIARQACDRTRQMLGCERVSVVEFDFEAELVKGVVVSTDQPSALGTAVVLPIAAIGSLEALRRGEVARWDDLTAVGDLPPDLTTLRDEGFRAYARIPMMVEDDLIAAMNLGSHKVGGISDGNIEIAAEIAGGVAVALRQARLHEQVSAYAKELESTVGELRAAHGVRRKLLSRLVAAQEEERQVVAAEIHDDSLQKMAAVGLRLDLLRRKLADPESAQEAGRLAELVNTTIDRLRHLMFELWPPGLEQNGFEAAVRTELVALKNEGEAMVSFDSRFGRALPMEVGTVAYRIIREALSNARRHSRARHIDVSLADLKGGLHAKITDDGVGIPTEVVLNPEPGHLGLSAMRERADLAGGWLKIHTPAEGATAGTEIEFWLPVEPAGASEDS